jgi:TPR repeat protein
MRNIAGIYAGNGYGLGVKQDTSKAREWFEKAADKGDAASMGALGLLYAPTNSAKAREWFEKGTDKDDAVSMVALGRLYVAGQGVPSNYAKARELFEKAADKGNAEGMRGLGFIYSNGLGVEQDYSKAREWLEKAADKGDAASMNTLGTIFEKGQGVPQDAAKAREWYQKAAKSFEKAADAGDPASMSALGLVYAMGQGVPQDAAKAREWFEKGADKGDANARQLETVALNEAAANERYGEALSFQDLLAAQTEKEETAQRGKPGAETAKTLGDVAWLAIHTREFTKALAAADRAHALLPTDLSIESNRAHALMFVGRLEEAQALYLAHKGDHLPEVNKSWDQVITEDFADFRKAGLTHPMMEDIEKQLSVAASAH